ncbi:MAG TPA: hypothetical protein VLJ11_07590 [Bryobacteraceae bacterium]|nr:hypothetical protein [Bryobacteraceae bacterium]
MYKVMLAVVLMLGIVACKPDLPAKNSSQVDAQKTNSKDTELKTDGGASQEQPTKRADDKQSYGEKPNSNASQGQTGKK